MNQATKQNWRVTLADESVGPKLVKLEISGLEKELAYPLSNQICTLLGCNKLGYLTQFHSIHQLYARRQRNLPRRSATDVLSPDGKLLSIIIPCDEVPVSGQGT